MKIIFNPYFFYLFLFYLNTFVGNSQTQSIFKKIDRANGLSNSRITGIIKEKNGFIWIGTQNGLNRFDGNDTKVFNKNNSNISSNDISDILLDAKNRIVIATNGGGICFYDKVYNTFHVYKNIIDKNNTRISNQVNTVFQDSDGYFWLGTEKGLVFFNEDTANFMLYPFKQKNNLNISSIYQDKNKNLWVGTKNEGLLLFNIKSGKFKKIIDNNNYKIQSVEVIHELNSDKILIGTFGNGLILVDIKTFKFSNFFNENLRLGKGITIVRSIEKDRKNNLWIGTDGYGLFEIQYPNSKEPIIKNYMYNSQLSSSLSGNSIYEILEDNDANIWIGTAWNGISILETKGLTEILYSDIAGINPSPVLSVYKNKNKLFLGLDGKGLTVYNYKTKQIITSKDNSRLNAKYIQTLSEEKNGYIWLGTFNNGLIKLNISTKKIEKFKNNLTKNSISHNNVRDIIIEDNDNLWIATWGGGLNYYDLKTNIFSNYSNDSNDSTDNRNYPTSNNIVSLENDGNKIWMATFGGGVNVFDKETKTFSNYMFHEKDSLSVSSNNVFSLLKDTHENLWIGTSGEGINRINLKTNKVERFNKNKNIRFSIITSIIEDDNKNIWFGSKDGIINYNYKSDSFYKFQNLNGEFHINSAFKDTLGNLYFGGIEGVLKFHPKNIKRTATQTKVKLTNFKLFNKDVQIDEKGILKKSISLEEEILLKHYHNVITFEFSALKFPFSKNTEYAIKMENFEDVWRNIGKDRTATFTNLSPGDYIFKVKSRDLGSNWGPDFTAIKISIQKPYWLTWWAYTLYFAIFLYILYLVRKYIMAWGKLKSSLELEKITHEKDTELYNSKQQFFTNISHEIRTPVTLILSSINRLFDNNKIKDNKQIKASHTIRRNSNLLLRLVNELLDVRKLETNDIVLNVSKNEFVSFAKEIYLSFSDIASDRNITYSFNTSENSLYLWFDANQLEKVVFNLLSNAFKFTNDKGKIELKIEANSNEVLLFVKDSGIGLSADNKEKIFNRFYQVKYTHTQNNKGFGLGLSIVKDIVKLHKGNINISSQLKKGSSFEVKLLKGNAHFKSNDIVISSKDLAEENTLEKIQKKVSDRKNKKETILIVEDHVEIQEALKELLENENYAILQAFNGMEGLKLASTSLPNLIISDVMMPEMDGIELSKKIKFNSITSHIPIIILTANTTNKDKMQGFETGADEYIIKPYDEDFLKNRIKNLLNGRKLLKQNFVNDKLLNPKELTVNSKDQIFLENLYKSLEENLQSNNLKSDFISKQMNMSHSSLYKKIKSLTGLTYIEFIRDYRLSIAKQLIEEMGYSVSEACYKVGYSDRKYFSKLFKSKFKENPSFYLKS